VKLAPKKLIRQRLGRSPNDSDAVALTFADESVDYVETPEMQKERALHDYLSAAGIEFQQNKYDPLSYMDTLTGDSSNTDYDYFS